MRWARASTPPKHDRTRIEPGRAAGACAVALTLSLAVGPVAAQQVLYDPVPPRGSAYVRFVNTTAAELALAPQFLPPRTLSADAAGRVSPYAAVERVAGRQLVLEARQGGTTSRLTFQAVPDGFLTVLLRAGPAGVVAVPVPDQPEFNQLRARLSFYNTTAACADGALTIDPGGQAVFAEVAPSTVKTRSVNPVVAQLRATCAGQSAPPFALEGLEPGGMYSIWLMNPGGAPVAFVSRDTTQRWR